MGFIEHLYKTLVGRFCSVGDHVVIYSSMRSGSTLLKALIASNSDFLHTNEIKINYFPNNAIAQYELNRLSNGKRLIVKHPSSFFYDYPNGHSLELINKRIVLFRNPLDTYGSIKKMVDNRDYKIENYDKEIFHNYWMKTYKNLWSLLWNDDLTMFVSYESITNNPIGITSQIFKFLGCENVEGVSKYSKPESGEWSWGKDDGGDKIQTLEVLSGKTFEEDDPDFWKKDMTDLYKQLIARSINI